MIDYLQRIVKWILYGRSAKSVRAKNEAFDAIWEYLINLDYQLREQRKNAVLPNYPCIDSSKRFLITSGSYFANHFSNLDLPSLGSPDLPIHPR